MIGWFDDARLHGYAKQIHSNGRYEEGLFYYHTLNDKDANVRFYFKNRFEGLPVSWDDYMLLQGPPPLNCLTVKVKGHHQVDSKLVEGQRQAD